MVQRVDTLPVRAHHVAIVSPETMTAAGLRSVVASVSTVGSVRCVGDVADAAGLGPADVVVYDLTLTLTRGPSELRRLVTSAPAAVLGLGRDFLPALTAQATALGVVGIISPRAGRAEVAALIASAARRTAGRSTPGAAHALTRAYRTSSRGEVGLTARERQVLRLIAAGRGNHEIARELSVSINTIKTYIRTGYRRIDVTTRVDAVRWWMEHERESAG